MIRRCAPAVAVGLAVVTVSAVLPGQESRRSTPPGTTKATAPKAEKVETAPKGAARVEVRDGAPVFDPLIVDLTHQYSQQLRPYLRAEMHRLRAVSRPTPEQFPTLDRDAERALVVAARAAAEAQRQRAWEKGQPITSLPEANQLVAEKLLEAAKDHLTPEQVARYRAEVERRIRERRSAAVRDLVASLDVRMALSADQREKLVASLIEHWDDSWGRDLERLGLPNDLHWLSPIPDPLVTPYLDEAQAKVWRSISKQNAVFQIDFIDRTGILLPEDRPSGGGEAGARSTPAGKAGARRRRP